MNLDDLEKKLSLNAEVMFWTVYLIVPLFTGLLAFNWLPNESYSPERDQLISSHQITDGEKTGTVYDVWKDKRTGQIFRLSDFEQHRRSESVRMAYTWFAYGLIGCTFFAFRQSRFAGKKFIFSFGQAAIVDLIIAIFTYFSLEATNNRIVGG